MGSSKDQKAKTSKSEQAKAKADNKKAESQKRAAKYGKSPSSDYATFDE